jgi:DNA topoisomerase II
LPTQIVQAVEVALGKEKSFTSSTAIRNSLMVFVNCLVENPDFDSQSKDYLTSVRSVSLASCKLPKTFLTSVVEKLGIVEDILYDNKMRERRRLLKATTAKTKTNVSTIALPVKSDWTFSLTLLFYHLNFVDENFTQYMHCISLRL